MIRGRNQIGDVARFFAAALHHHRLHIRRMPRKNLDRISRHNFRIAIQQHHLPALNQRIVIRTHIADRVALQLQPPMLPLLPLRVILRLGKCRDYLITAPNRIPSAVIKMQMCVDDNVDILGRNSQQRAGCRATSPAVCRSAPACQEACCQCQSQPEYFSRRCVRAANSAPRRRGCARRPAPSSTTWSSAQRQRKLRHRENKCHPKRR